MPFFFAIKLSYSSFMNMKMQSKVMIIVKPVKIVHIPLKLTKRLRINVTTRPIVTKSLSNSLFLKWIPLNIMLKDNKEPPIASIRKFKTSWRYLFCKHKAVYGQHQPGFAADQLHCHGNGWRTAYFQSSWWQSEMRCSK